MFMNKDEFFEAKPDGWEILDPDPFKAIVYKWIAKCYLSIAGFLRKKNLPGKRFCEVQMLAYTIRYLFTDPATLQIVNEIEKKRRKHNE